MMPPPRLCITQYRRRTTQQLQRDRVRRYPRNFVQKYYFFKRDHGLEFTLRYALCRKFI